LFLPQYHFLLFFLFFDNHYCFWLFFSVLFFYTLYRFFWLLSCRVGDIWSLKRLLMLKYHTHNTIINELPSFGCFGFLWLLLLFVYFCNYAKKKQNTNALLRKLIIQVNEEFSHLLLITRVLIFYFFYFFVFLSF